MEILQWLLFVSLISIGVGMSMVHGQDQSEFISIDCGGKDGSTDSTTTIEYIPDAPFIDRGETNSIAAEFITTPEEQKQWHTLRSFPEGNRSCYKVPVKQGTRYLIRAYFMHGNYDGRFQPLQFDLHIGTDKWATVDISDVTSLWYKEIIHVATRNHEHVCLVDTGSGRPFISALEFRPLNSESYDHLNTSLALEIRCDVASDTNKTIRYPDDVHDRIWDTCTLENSYDTSTTQTNFMSNDYQLPSAIMRTAAIPLDDPLIYEGLTVRSSSKIFTYLHFSEFESLRGNETIRFTVSLSNEEEFIVTVDLDYLGTDTQTLSAESFFTDGNYNFSLDKAQGSALSPYINAFEVYAAVDLQEPQSDEKDADAIMNIKLTYGIKRNWQGDPCSPRNYSWEGIVCNYDHDSPRITSLNLTSNGLTGGICANISDLNLLESLDLSNNGLTGLVPDFLSQMNSLKTLNLSGNKLTGSVPPGLIERERSGLQLSLNGNPINSRLNGNPINSSLNGNPKLSQSSPSKKEMKFLVPVVASIAALLLVATTLTALFWCFRTQKQQVPVAGKANKTCELLESKKKEFTFDEVKNITNNFERVLGKGGFGTVYHGLVDDIQVAVKMISPSSFQGYKQFEAEVKVLFSVYHGNLTTLVGFCDEGAILALVYEYMANGDLHEHLSERNPNTLNWKRRLQISLDAAKGLEYLHHGCKPPIVHRDVKATNILLNDKFQAKLSDFGLSRMFPVESDDSHILTFVVGTPGYLDPEYYESNWLTEKSDVYSFGLVLLNIITGKSETAKSIERSRLRQWVDSLLENGDITAIVDPILAGQFGINSAWRAVEIAVSCMSSTSAERPNMNRVVAELNECLAIELAANEPNISIAVETPLIPLARLDQFHTISLGAFAASVILGIGKFHWQRLERKY